MPAALALGPVRVPSRVIVAADTDVFAVWCFVISSQVAEETLSDWGSDISELLHLVEKTCHLINKENMLHKV